MNKLILTGFAAGRHTPTSGRTYFKGTTDELLRLIRAHWKDRKPGQGRTDITGVVIVPMSKAVAKSMFHCNTVRLHPERYNTPLKATTDRRQENEEPFIKVVAQGGITIQPDFAWAVCYHHDLLQPEEREGKEFVEGEFGGDWYVVSLGASDVENEPIHGSQPTRQARRYGRSILV